MKIIVKPLDEEFNKKLSKKEYNVLGEADIKIEDGILYVIDSSKEKAEIYDLQGENILISFSFEENISKEIKQAEEIKMLRTEDTFEIYQLMRAGFVVSKNSPYQVYHPLTNVEVCRVTSGLFDYIANQKLVDNSNSMYLTLKGN